MPYEAAKAIAATFCYNIRYALTPVFGVDFLSLCILPEDPSFGRMVINPDIVRQCTETANGLRVLSRGTYQACSPETPSLSGSRWTPKSLRPKPVNLIDMESGYGTDTDHSDRCLGTPQAPVSLQWTALNGRPSATLQERHPTTSQPITPDTRVLKYRGSRESSCSEEGRGVKRRQIDKDDDYDGESPSTYSSDETTTPLKRRKRSTALMKDARAAYMLMKLHMRDASLGGNQSRGGRRRASS